MTLRIDARQYVERSKLLRRRFILCGIFFFCGFAALREHLFQGRWFGRVPASVWIAPYDDPPKQESSAENACLMPFARLRGSRTQSTSRCRALAGEWMTLRSPHGSLYIIEPALPGCLRSPPGDSAGRPTILRQSSFPP